MAPLFSIVVIARNEARTISRLLDSLGGFMDRGGEVLVVDTGSSDETMETARARGCRVHGAGLRFESRLDAAQVAEITARFASEGEGPLVAPGDRLFHFAAARQYAAGLAAGRFVLQLDAGDEALALNVERLDEWIGSGSVGRFEYEQLYGGVGLRISRFYDTRRFHWEGRVHEGLFETPDAPPAATIRCDRTQLLVRHHKDEAKPRPYLAGLALQAIEAPGTPRWGHYLARELFYQRRYRSAIALLEAHAATESAWAPERSQSLCFVGESLEALGRPGEAEAAYRRAARLDPGRREPHVRLATMYCASGRFEAAAESATAALAVARTSPYPELDANYTWIPHSILYWSLFWLGRRDEARRHWQACRDLTPDDPRVQEHARLFQPATVAAPAISPARIRVKVIGDWCSPEQLCREWDRMSQGGYRWNDLEITWEDRDVDFYVIVNRPWETEFYDPARTIVFQMEPWCGQDYQTWGVKTWGPWAKPDRAAFLQVRGHATHLNNAFWQLDATYHELKTRPIVKSRDLAAICGPKYFDPGHVKRVDFLKYLEAKDDDVVRVDVYAYANPLGFRNYRGQGPDGKDGAMLPYRYFFAAENNRERNFITEKLWEPLLAESLCFYWGCPNAADHVDPRAFIPLDLDDFETSFHVMKRAILAREWERRLPVIRAEKQKVLDHLQFFPTLERVLRHELQMPDHPSDEAVTYHKYFHDLVGRRVRTAAFVHSCLLGGDTAVLDELVRSIVDSGLRRRLDGLFVINLGDELAVGDRDRYASDGVHVIDYSSDVNLFERPTLDLLRLFSRFHAGSRVLYLHTKGVSHASPRPSVDDWRRYMLYFLVEHHEACLRLLERHDTVGCNLLDAPRRHYSGNFWWANADYLGGLPPVPPGDRHASEWWLLGGDGGDACSLWDSGVDHYRHPYPREAYDTEATRRRLRRDSR